MKIGHQPIIALIVNHASGHPVLAGILTQVEEIKVFEDALYDESLPRDPMAEVEAYRSRVVQDDEEFADFVETLLAQPGVRVDVQEHASLWFKSKRKIENFKKAEIEASKVIAQYAFQVYCGDVSKTDFTLAGPTAQVRVVVFECDQVSTHVA